jgi:fibronectin type 3 domain-containing protein
MSKECFEIMELQSTKKARSRARTFRIGASLCLFGFCLIASSSQAANVTLGWDPSTDTDVAGYNVYYGPGTQNYTNMVDAGNSTTCSIFGLVIGATYYFTVTAYNELGLESPPSEEIVYQIPPGLYPPKIPPASATVTNGVFGFDVRTDPGRDVIIQTSTDLVHWQSIGTNRLTDSTLRIAAPATNLIRVFRALFP